MIEMIRNYCFWLLMLCCLTAVAQSVKESQGGNAVSTEISQVPFKKLVDSSNNYYFSGNYRKSLEVNLALLRKALASNNNFYIHRGYRHLGYDYLAMNDTILAQENFEKSEKFAKLSKNDTATALTYMDLANLYSTVHNDHQTALKYHDKSIALFKKIKDSTGLAKAHYNTIITALEAEEYNKAFLNLVKAKKLRDYEKHPSYSVGIECLFGEYYLGKKNYKMADLHLNKVIEVATKEKLQVELEDAYYLLSESLFEQKRYEEAFEARKEYEEFMEQNMESLTSAKVEAMSAKFQVSEYRKDVLAAELENELQAKIVASQKRLNFILIGVALASIVLVVGLLFAIRKRKKLVRLLRFKNQEYLKAKSRSEQLAKAKGRFFSTVSHELRTPLYGVIGLSTLLLEDEQLKSHEKDLKSLKFSADYLLALINDVLQINKIESNNLDNEHSAFNLKELIESIVASFQYMKLQNNNHIEIQISEGIPDSLKGNHVRLSQILMNLVGNACKFTENGQIVVSATEKQSNKGTIAIEFKVSDTGLGIAKEKFSEIFDEFSQLDSMNYNYQGTGLGLPIVKKLLNQSNSEIKIDSELGKGSTFSFELSYEVLRSEIPKETIVVDSKALAGKKILIAEDNRINQIVTKKILEKNEIVCTVAENGAQATDFCKKEGFDLVLMDLNMPVQDGFEATREIRKFNPFLPIVALTAVEIEEVRNEIYEAGMNDIIVKPYDVNKFIQTILKNLNERKVHLVRKEEKKAI